MSRFWSWLRGTSEPQEELVFEGEDSEKSTEELVIEPPAKPTEEYPGQVFGGFREVGSSESSQEYEDPSSSFSEEEAPVESKKSSSGSSSESSRYEDAPLLESSEPSQSVIDFGKFCECVVEVSEAHNENVGTVVGAYLGDMDLVDKFVKVFEELKDMYQSGLIMIPENFFGATIDQTNTVTLFNKRLRRDMEIKRITDIEIGIAMDKIQSQMLSYQICKNMIENGNAIKYNYIFNAGSKPNESLFGIEGSEDMHRLATEAQLEHMQILYDLRVHPSYHRGTSIENVEGQTLILVSYDRNFDVDTTFDLKNITERFEIIRKISQQYMVAVHYDGFVRDEDTDELYIYYVDSLETDAQTPDERIRSSFYFALGPHLYQRLLEHPEFVKEHAQYLYNDLLGFFEYLRQ